MRPRQVCIWEGDIGDMGEALVESSTPARLPVCLLAEDEAVLATLLELEFSEAGFEVAGPFKRVGDALAWLENATPDIAIIDTMLADGSSARLAVAMKQQSVRFIVHSGSDPGPNRTDDAFTGAPWLTKPVLPSTVVEAARRLLGG